MVGPLQEKKDRNLEFYKRWKIDGESLNDLLVEYKISYPRAFVIKKQVEKKYPDEIGLV
jgi:hypothetical protein